MRISAVAHVLEHLLLRTAFLENRSTIVKKAVHVVYLNIRIFGLFNKQIYSQIMS